MTRIATKTPSLPVRHVLAVALAVTLQSTASFALGSAEQRAACTPDVFRLCSSEIPNVDRIIACLKKEKSNLSPGCQAVFSASATRSLNAASEWCVFNNRLQEQEQANWLNWCGAAATKP